MKPVRPAVPACLSLALPALAGTLKCPPDSVKVGNVCIDPYEESVRQVPLSNKTRVKKSRRGGQRWRTSPGAERHNSGGGQPARQIVATHRRFVKAMEGRLASMRTDTEERCFAVLSVLVAKLEAAEKPMREIMHERLREEHARNDQERELVLTGRCAQSLTCGTLQQ